MALKELSDGGSEGTRLGQSTSDKVGFFGTTPVALQGGTALATITVTISTADTGFGFATSAGFNALVAQVEAIRAALAAYGIVKTS